MEDCVASYFPMMRWGIRNNIYIHICPALVGENKILFAMLLGHLSFLPSYKYITGKIDLFCIIHKHKCWGRGMNTKHPFYDWISRISNHSYLYDLSDQGLVTPVSCDKALAMPTRVGGPRKRHNEGDHFILHENRKLYWLLLYKIFQMQYIFRWTVPGVSDSGLIWLL